MQSPSAGGPEHQAGSFFKLEMDYDLHGWVGVRVVDATPAEVAVVDRQLGPIRSTLDRAPDLILRFVDRLEPAGRLRYLGLEEAAFTDDAFLLLRTKYGTRARVQIPFEQVGGRCEIVCERGIRTIPLLIPLLNLTALGKGLLPLHASAFRYRGVGVLVTGWSKGGKTEALLAFMARGAEYIGDEWVYVSPDGNRMFGIPEPIRVWDWHLRELPEYRARLRPRERVCLSAYRSLSNSSSRFLTRTHEGSLANKLAARAASLFERHVCADLPPERLFPGANRGVVARCDRVFFVGSHAAPTIDVQPITSREVGERMVFSLQYERQDLISYYHQFRFALPGRQNPLLEQAEARQREHLSRVLAERPVYSAYHPYPVSLPALFDSMSAVC